MKRLLHLLRTSEFIRHNGIFFVGSLAVSAVNYLYYPVLGRLLATAQFGEVQALLAIFMPATLFLTVLSNVAVNVVTNETDTGLRNRLVFELERLATAGALVVVVIAVILVRPLQAFFQFPEVAPFYALGLALILSAPLALRTAFLRGRSAFGRLSVNSLVGATGKLVASVALVVLGTGTFGAIGGLVVAQGLALLLAARQARQLGLRSAGGTWLRRPNLQLVRPQLPYALLTLIVSLVTSVLTGFDILVVKHFFSAETAGLYAGVATIARIIYFITGSIAGVLLSSIKRSYPAQRNRQLLLRSAALQVGIGLPVLVVFTVVPDFVIRLLIGAKYLAYAPLLGTLSLVLFLIAGLNLVLSYDLALRRWSAAVIAIVGSVLAAVFVSQYHGSPQAVVNALLYAVVLTLVLRLVDTVWRQLVQRDQPRPN